MIDDELESLKEKYPKILEDIQDRLLACKAENLCGMATFATQLDRRATYLVALMTLTGGFRYGLLPLVLDIASFLEGYPEFKSSFGSVEISRLIACLSDALGRQDAEAIEEATKILRGKESETPNKDRSPQRNSGDCSSSEK